MSSLNMRFPDCENCINKEYDPFQCERCEDGSNCELEDDTEELTYAEFIDLLRD